jgi:hypothetical protein
LPRPPTHPLNSRANGASSLLAPPILAPEPGPHNRRTQAKNAASETHTRAGHETESATTRAAHAVDEAKGTAGAKMDEAKHRAQANLDKARAS